MYLPLRDWKDASLEENIEDYYFRHLELSIDIENIIHKTLFIFDGYEDLKEEYKREFLRLLTFLKNYIITSRPVKDPVGDVGENARFEIIGFNNEGVPPPK